MLFTLIQCSSKKKNIQNLYHVLPALFISLPSFSMKMFSLHLFQLCSIEENVMYIVLFLGKFSTVPIEKTLSLTELAH